MDAPVSPGDADINGVFFLKIENASFPENKRAVIKYTKLPDFEFDSKVSWPKQSSYTLQPRLRRIIELDDQELQTTRSLKPDRVAPSRINSTSYTKRKIVTITENEENSQVNLGRSGKTSNRATATILKDEKHSVQRSTSRLTNPPKYSRESKITAKTNNMTNKKDNSVHKLSINAKSPVNNRSSADNVRTRGTKDRELIRNPKPTPTAPKINVSKNLVNPSKSEKEINLMSKKLLENSRNIALHKQPLEKKRTTISPLQSKTRIDLLKEIKSNSKPVTVIRVPLDDFAKGPITLQEISLERNASYVDHTLHETDHHLMHVDASTDMGTQINPKDAEVETTPPPTMVNQATGTSRSQLDNFCNLQDSSIQTEVTKDVFDKLEIPNVTLTKEKSNFSKEEIVSFCSHSTPNLQTPSFKISPEEENDVKHLGFSNSKSYIIGRATLTYTTKQKINFHVVGNSDDNPSNPSPSPLAYPLNVVSIFKKNLNNCVTSESCEEVNLTNDKEKPSSQRSNLNELQALNCSYVFNSSKLVKPSDLISTIKVSNGFLQNDYISEQFQRELHFIDSFFESLQYLENCSLSEKCFPHDRCENWVNATGLDLKNSDYNSFLSKLENGTNTLAHVDDIETMASKSLCLLNLLIRDEQRRAKDLLFVLKMREDALKDFTKSQIIWLENKKKQDNTDVSTLKKKQRGALLKLQHECGEMHRMRKALLTLSEKRKAALMKTRSNIELKLKNNVDVDQILLGKKKLKRNVASDRNVAPLKCFDLSSSGCDESPSSKHKLESAPLQELPPPISSAEKCIQTGESVLETAVLVNQATDTAAEHFVAVDGTYLNILFQNLSLPQIFSGGKQYEVNEEALRNIVNSSNNVHHNEHCDSDVVENFMDKIKKGESDRSSSPSTAHSLVDEFDQYYKGLGDDGKSPVDCIDTECHKQSHVHEIKETYVQASDLERCERSSGQSTGNMRSISTETVMNQSDSLFVSQHCSCDSLIESPEAQLVIGRDVTEMANPAGPLPVPPGEASSPEPVAADGPDTGTTTLESSNSRSAQVCPSVSLTSHGEAEELRRQQLAIEREIKALEQQQSQLLVVREIPDKPPPPYTPPSNQSHKVPRMFLIDDSLEQKIVNHMKQGAHLDVDPSEPFDVFIQDIFHESLSRQQTELSDEPWDACNLLPHKQEQSQEQIGQKAISEIKDVLSGVPPSIVSGVGGRRSDHIDDILFAEWRRCEPEWTALHTDEAVVKNQAFESIFQKVLNETIEEYKRTVLGVDGNATRQSHRSQHSLRSAELQE